MDRKKFAKKILSLFLASAMIIGIAPVNTFAETTKANWTIDEKKEAEMSFWRLSNRNKVTVVANAEGIKTPSINYIGTYVNDEGRTVLRLSFRMFQNLASDVWSKALFKFDKDLYDLIDFSNPKTGMYKGAENGVWHDSAAYKDVSIFTDVVSSISGAVNVKEQNLDSNGNKLGGSARLEIPIDLVLKDGKTVDDLVGQPHVQMRITNKDYSQVFCVAGTEKTTKTADPNSAVNNDLIVTPYNSYTFMTYVPSKNNNADVNTVSDYNVDYQFYSANSYAKYNEKGGYIDVFHKQSKLNSADNIGGESFAFRQVFNEKFAEVLKPQDESGTVAKVFAANQQGEMWNTTKPIMITESDLNTSANSDLNPGFTGIQVASTFNNSTIGQKFAGLNTVLTTTKPQDSFLNSATTEFNSGLPTITRYYVDKDKVAEKGLKLDDLASFDFYSTFILDGTKKFIEYTATNNTGSDIVLAPNSKLGLTYADNPTSTPNLELVKYSLTFGDDAYKIELRSNFKHTGKGLNYEYNLIPGMTIKAGEKIAFRTMKYNKPPTKVTLTLPGKDGKKTIDLLPDQKGAEKTTPRRLNYITTYAGGSATQSGLNPDIDELFTDSKNITGRTRYKQATIKLFYPDGSKYPFTIADQKTRTKMNINGAELDGYTFTTEGKTGFTMPAGLVKDSVIGITNTDAIKAAVPSEKVEEKVQAKVTFDLNGGKLPTTTKSFEGYDNTKLPGTEFAYKLARASETAPVVRIAPMNGKKATDAHYTPNGFKVDKYIDHNGDQLKGDALELRKIAENPTKDGQQFYGWTTKKVSSVEEYNKLEELTTADRAKDTTKTYKFTENSPILTGTTVYAFYGAAKSVEANPVQKYDETTDKQYIESILPEGKTLPAGATVELVQKNSDGTYPKVNVPVEVKDGKATFDVKNENIKDGEKYYVAIKEDGKPTTYSTNHVKIDKAGPSFVGDGKNDLVVTQDPYGYQVTVAANAQDDSGILRVYLDDDKNNGYYKADASQQSGGFKATLQNQQGEEKTVTVTAVDKFGNKSTATHTFMPQIKDIVLETMRPRAGKDFVTVTSAVEATIKVELNGQVIGKQTLESETEKIKLSQKLTKGDRLVITATLDGNVKTMKSRVR
ncbi:hypothetical protein B9N49_07475 [Finegoldia magna]|uniref:Repeat protein n=1 Tax=Finegoldia magna TaxID=1260 RepID=A0A233V2T2_FINMA|nr:hypothetical protein [Finegoldia magna]OXZ26715.1 hypothetical protein B9N49_07475 [Finegoldia magna]